MNLFLDVPYNGMIYSFTFLNGCKSSRLEIKDVFIIDLFKEHNHSYFFKAFFYKSTVIYSSFYCNSKIKLYRAVQELLKEELYHV